MSRLYDEIIWSDKKRAKSFGDGEFTQSVVFDITQPAHDYLKRMGNKYTNSVESYYVLQTPYRNNFFEFSVSKLMKDKFNFPRDLNKMGFYVREFDKDVKNKFKSKMGYPIQEIYFCHLFCLRNSNVFDGPEVSFAINKKGEPIKISGGSSRYKYENTRYESQEGKRLLNYGKGCLYFSLQLVNCSNITEKEHSPSKSLAKKQRKEKGSAQTVYKTLHIDPNSKSYDSKGAGEGSRRKHFVRGHFRHLKSDYYSDDKQGTVTWVDPHVRGNSKNGKVKKDYKVKA